MRFEGVFGRLNGEPEVRRLFETPELDEATQTICARDSERTAAARPGQSTDPHRISPFVDTQHIAELRRTLGESRLDYLLTLLASDLEERAAQISSGDQPSDLSGLRNEIHNLRGMVASFGLRGVALAAMAVELAGPGVEVESALDRFQSEVGYALSWLRNRTDTK